MARKSGGLIALFWGLFVSAMPFASALDARSISESVIRFYEDFLGPIFAALFGQYNTTDFLFAKVLLFFLLIFVIYFILKKSHIFGHKKGLITLVSIIVSLLALRYLPENDLINGILLPYSVLGIALTTFLPFLIYFFFVHKSDFGAFGRRIAWVLYGAIFIALLITRWKDVSPTSEWIYISGIALVALSLLWDKSVHNYFYESKLKRALSGSTRDVINSYMDKREVALAQGDLKRAEEIKEIIINLGGKVED